MLTIRHFIIAIHHGKGDRRYDSEIQSIDCRI